MPIIGAGVEQSRFSRRFCQGDDRLEGNLARAAAEHSRGIVVGEVTADALPRRASIARSEYILVSGINGRGTVRGYQNRSHPLGAEILVVWTDTRAALRTGGCPCLRRNGLFD